MSTLIGGALFCVCYYRARFAGGLIKARIARQWMRSTIGITKMVRIAPAIIVKLSVPGGSGKSESLLGWNPEMKAQSNNSLNRSANKLAFHPQDSDA